MRNKLKVDKLIAKELYFRGYNYIVDRYWEIGPEEIYPKCLEYRYTSYKGYSKTPKYYIYLIKLGYINIREINFSTIIIIIRNKLKVDKLIAKELYFRGYNYTTDRY